MNAIECEHLTRAYGRALAVNDVTFAVPAGSIFALLGPNGAGKTTTLKLLLNLLRPTSGLASVLGCETTRLTKAHFRRIGYVAEDQIYPEWMTVSQLLDYYRPFYPSWDDALARRLTVMFDLPEDRPLKKLSRGMRMKAILLTILPFHPELLLLDEPFGGLDPQVRDDFIRGMLETVGSDRPNTVIISSHDIAEVEQLADWVGILLGGKLILAEPMISLQARFRRLEIVGASVASRLPDRLPPAWLKVERPASTVVQLIHNAFTNSVAAEAEVRAILGEIKIKPYPMTLREIFLVHSDLGRIEKKGQRHE
ncbi:MAG TPA: ABC transporter ATP-binding protein [Opitutaceae bacterium]|nr:ABC transporter ATP-binding protein [Opitutaceae bacterium]